MVMFEDRYIGRNPSVSAPSSRVSIAADGPQAEVFRASPVEPWRIVRTRLRVAGAAEGPIEGGGRRRRLLHRRDRHDDLSRRRLAGRVCRPVVHRRRGKQHRPSQDSRAERRRVHRAPRRSGREFVASTDNWFRPAQFANGPDGGLYIVDVYREVIEHPLSLPPEIKRHFDLTSGRDRGRIYRLVPDGFKERPSVAWQKAESAALVAALENANGWTRDTAARLLFERQDAAAVAPLEKLAAESKSPLGRMHALYAWPD